MTAAAGAGIAVLMFIAFAWLAIAVLLSPFWWAAIFPLGVQWICAVYFCTDRAEGESFLFFLKNFLLNPLKESKKAAGNAGMTFYFLWFFPNPGNSIGVILWFPILFLAFPDGMPHW